MAKTCMILGPSGDGKSTSLVTNPDGTVDFDNYNGIKSSETVILNADGKDLPFPATKLGWKEGENLYTSTYDKPMDPDRIESYLDAINKGSKINKVIIDTLNGSMNDKEMLETKKMTFDKWYETCQCSL